MSVWEKYTNEQREEYKNYLKMYGALSAMFNQKSSETGAPYLDSKFQETIYARSFDSENVDVGNTPHDIESEINGKRYGIGIKTWLNSKPSYQKVMQLKRYKDEIDPLANRNHLEELALKLAEIKNSRLETDYKRLGLVEQNNVYHYVTRDKGKVVLTETSYPKVDIKTLKPGEFTKSSFYFSDGLKDYKYTFGDSQIWMKFNDNKKDYDILDTIDIDIMEDPFLFLKNAFFESDSTNEYTINNGILVPKQSVKRDYLYLPLYSYRSKKVEAKSGLNAWNADPKNKNSNVLRPKGEAYIPIPKIVWKKHKYWFDKSVDMSDYKAYKQNTGKNSYTFNLHLPDGQVIEAGIMQDNFKSLQTSPQNILGSWILDVIGFKNPQRTEARTPAKEVVTLEMLRQKGFDSIKLWHEDPNNPKDVWIDFAGVNSFEKFINNEIVEEEE